MDGQTGGQPERWMKKKTTNGWIGRSIDQQMDGCINRWMDGLTDGQMVRPINGWTDLTKV